MKKPMNLLIAMAACLMSMAAGSNENPNTASYVSTDEEVGMSLERAKGEVLIHLSVKDLSQYEYVVIERSAENANYFAKCKYINGNEPQTGKEILQVDKYPYSAAKDVYYRIKTVTKDGIERAYPAVMLAAAN
jgi:hypothetical protein